MSDYYPFGSVFHFDELVIPPTQDRDRYHMTPIVGRGTLLQFAFHVNHISLDVGFICDGRLCWTGNAHCAIAQGLFGKDASSSVIRIMNRLNDRDLYYGFFYPVVFRDRLQLVFRNPNYDQPITISGLHVYGNWDIENIPDGVINLLPGVVQGRISVIK